MEKVNAVKKIALFMVIVGLAVAMVACQGPVGTPGDKGDKGDTGDTGDTGGTGPQGTSQIVKTEKPSELILLNQRADTTLGAGVATADVTGYFRGGKKPITYEIVELKLTEDGFEESIHATDAIFKATLDKDTGILTVAAKDRGADVVAAKRATGETVMIKAIDVDKIAADPVMLTIKANSAPMPGAAFVVKVGVQNAKDALRDGLNNTTGAALLAAAQPNPVCATFAACVFTIALPAREEATVNATYISMEEGGTAGQPVTIISDDDVKGTTFSVEEYDTAFVMASASDAKITISGVKSTWVADTDTSNEQPDEPGHKPTTVRIKATDANGLMVETNMMVSVDEPPTLSKTFTLQGAYTVTPPKTDELIGGLDRFFDDKEDDPDIAAALTFKVASSNRAVAEIPANGIITGADLTLMGYSQGTSTITLTATDSRGQSVSTNFTVTVK